MEEAAQPADLRARKRALVGLIELAGRLIDQREATTDPDSSEEITWYAEQTARLDRFKMALDAARLQPDEFPVRVPSEWMYPGGAKTPNRAIDCTLRINSRSQTTFVRSGSRSFGSCSTDAGEAPEDAVADSAACRPRIFFIDELRTIRCEAGPTDAPVPSLVLGWRQRGAAATLRCFTPEAIELSEVLGLHLRRYNQSRVATAKRLAQVHALKSTPYSSANEAHEELLRRLWQCGFPGVPLTQRVTPDWIRIGFQGPDPATDFRGMGVLGLQNLLYFGEHFPDVFARLVNAQRKRDYPLACAGINVTFMLLELLQLNEDSHEAIKARPPFSEAWDTDMFRFFCHMFYRDSPFEDMYCFALRMLDRIFVSLDADYADFPSVVAVLRTRLQEALAQRPLSFREFKGFFRTATTAGDATSDTRSSHSHDLLREDDAPAEHELSRLLSAIPRGLEAVKGTCRDWSSNLLRGGGVHGGTQPQGQSDL